MSRSLVVLVVAMVVATTLLVPSNVEAASGKRVMPWMCLQRCGDSMANITAQLLQLNDHRDIITAVAFEKYNLGPNSTLISAPELADVLPTIQKMGFKSWAMVR